MAGAGSLNTKESTKIGNLEYQEGRQNIVGKHRINTTDFPSNSWFFKNFFDSLSKIIAPCDVAVNVQSIFT